MPFTLTKVQSAYAGAHFGKSLYWYATEMVFAYFLAEQYGFSPAVLGSLLLLFLFWDAVTDPLIILMTGGRRASLSGLLKTQFVGSILSGGSFALIFFRPNLEGGWLFAYAIGAGLLFRSAYTVLDVPQNTLLGRLGADQRGVKLLASVRMVCSALATLVIAGLAALALDGRDSAAAKETFLLFALFAGAGGIGSAFLLLRGGSALAQEDTQHHARLVQSDSEQDYRGRLRQLSLVFPLLIGMFFSTLGWPVFSKLLPFYADYVLESPRFTGALVAGVALATLVVQPVWALVMQRLDWTFSYCLAALVVLAGTGLFMAMGAHSAGGAWLAVLVLAAGASMFTALIWAHLAYLLSTPELAQVDDLLAFGALTLTAKLSLGLGGLLVAGLLEMADYQRGAMMGLAERELLVWLMAGIVALATTLCSLLIVPVCLRWKGVPSSPTSTTSSTRTATS